MNKELSAGTGDEKQTNADSQHVSLACIKPNVVRSPLLSDYMHLYLGCKAVVCRSFKGIFNYWAKGDNAIVTPEILMDLGKDGKCTYTPEFIKPVLRRLTAMTKDEIKLWRKASEIDVISGDSVIQQNANSSAYLLSIGIDLFGLIDSGLAIEDVSKR